ncbi:MAG: hypothetical protein ABFR05_07925 [Bacteroidota bacterium]
MKQILLIILLLFTIQLSAQKESVIINGVVKTDSVYLENIHIINKSSNRGTVTNEKGEFRIYVKLNDSILISGVQFFNKWIQISKHHFERKLIIVDLIQKNNELGEVVIENMAKSLGLPNADKKPLNKLDRALTGHSQESVPIVILATLLGQQGGIDDLYYIISGNRKRDRKLKELLLEDKQKEIDQEYIREIRNHFQDDFFINTLQIPRENIDSLIGYCLPKGIVFLFERKRYLEVMDVFIQNKEEYMLTVD